MQPVLAAIQFTTGLFVVVWIGFLLSLLIAKIQFRVMKERQLQEAQAQAGNVSPPAPETGRATKVRVDLPRSGEPVTSGERRSTRL